MDQFSDQLHELDCRLRKGLLLGKDLKQTEKLRESAQSSFRKTADVQVEVLDLKAEVVGLKNKLFVQE